MPADISYKFSSASLTSGNEVLLIGQGKTMSVDWLQDGNYPINTGESISFHSNNSVNRPQLSLSPSSVISPAENFSVTTRVKINASNTNVGRFKVFEVAGSTPASFYSVYAYKDDNAQIKFGLEAQLGINTFVSTKSEIIAKNRYYNITLTFEELTPGGDIEVSFIVDGIIFDTLTLNWGLPVLWNYYLDGVGTPGLNNLNILIDVYSLDIHAPIEIPETEYANVLSENQCKKPPCTDRPADFVFINWISNECESLPNPDYTFPFIPTQKRLHAQLADGGITYPLDLSQIQKLSNVPVTNLVFQYEDGTLAVWDFSQVIGRKRVILKDGIVSLSDSAFPDLFPFSSPLLECWDTDKKIGVVNAFKICSTDEGAYLTLSLIPKCCCPGFEDQEDLTVMTLNDP